MVCGVCEVCAWGAPHHSIHKVVTSRKAVNVRFRNNSRMRLTPDSRKRCSDVSADGLYDHNLFF